MTLENLQERIKEYYISKHQWLVVWKDIKIEWNGWYLMFVKKHIIPDCTGTAWLLKKPWEIHIVQPMQNDMKKLPYILAHEVCHCWQVERERFYLLKYALDYMSKGYKNVRYEVEARQVGNDFVTWLNDKTQ